MRAIIPVETVVLLDNDYSDVGQWLDVRDCCLTEEISILFISYNTIRPGLVNN